MRVAHTDTPLLDQIDSPADLRCLPLADLPRLADELRRFLLASVARTGGHLAANLGTIELTIALHYVFNTPDDRLVWDVGHQAYAHKILTGRRERMTTLRQRGGLAGFPKRDESHFDAFGVGHSSTSISAALGMALAARLAGLSRKHIAVIGDGAMTAGMAFEALNHAGALPENQRPDLLVVLNDNEMSISPNVGALHQYLMRVISGSLYGQLRAGGKRVLGLLPPVHDFAARAEEHVKGMIVSGTLFEELGFRSFGPVDGHDVRSLVALLRNLRAHDGPRLLHVVTRKGHGFPPAEADPCGFHGVNAFALDGADKIAPESTPNQAADATALTQHRAIQKPADETPKKSATSLKSRSWTEGFSKWIETTAAQDEHLVAITPAMREGSGLTGFAKRFPDRYHDVGIAEQHAVTLAAGLACEGLKPVVAIYSTFLQRAMDQLIHDVALQDLDVTFAVDRAGVVGPDGPTHAGSFDIALLRSIPRIRIAAPGDAQDLERLLSAAYHHPGPAAVRWPRGAMPVLADLSEPATESSARVLRRGQSGTALLNFGALLPQALEAASSLDLTLVDMRWVKPLDSGTLNEIAVDHSVFVTLEDHAVCGGAGSAVLEWTAERSIKGQPAPRTLTLGLPDCFIEHGSREDLLANAGLDPASICARITAVSSANSVPNAPIDRESERAKTAITVKASCDPSA